MCDALRPRRHRKLNFIVGYIFLLDPLHFKCTPSVMLQLCPWGSRCQRFSSKKPRTYYYVIQSSSLFTVKSLKSWKPKINGWNVFCVLLHLKDGSKKVILGTKFKRCVQHHELRATDCYILGDFARSNLSKPCAIPSITFLYVSLI